MASKAKKRCPPRNPLYDHPLMRKGGVHQKSHKTLRRANKQALKKMDDEVMIFR